MQDEKKADVFSLETTFLNLKDILGGERFFVIPNYQRGYAWEKEHVNELWTDILILAKNDSNESHYMGVLALTKTDDNSVQKLGYSGCCYDVIDGQQRLTTLMIILTELSRYFPNIKKEYIMPYDYSFKLNYVADGKNWEFLKNNIYKDGDNKPKNIYQKNLQNAKEIIREKISNVSDEVKKVILDCVLERLEFNLYFNPKQFDAKKTFETMNYRGKDLSNLELLKNKLIFLSTKIKDKGPFLINEITTAWEEIYENLGFNPNQMLRDDEFLKAHWIIYGKESINVKEKGDAYATDILKNYFVEGKYDEEIEDFIEVKNSFEKIMDYVQSLKACSKYWMCVKFPVLASKSIEMTKDEIEILDKLSRIRTFIFVDALVLATLVKKDTIENNLRLKLYGVLEKFIFINFCIQSRNKSNDLSFCKTQAKNIFTSDDKEKNNKEIEDLINELENTHEKLAINSRLKRDVLPFLRDEISVSYYDEFKKGLNYFLFEYNRQLQSDKNSVPLDWSSFKTDSIEHILPQKYMKIKSWQRAMEKYQSDGKLLKTIVNNIGNLVGLTTNAKNASLGNNSYYIKSQIDLSKERQSYKKGTMAEMLIADKYETWTVKDIYDRAKDLLKFMYNNWFKSYLDEEEFDNDLDAYIGFLVLENDDEQNKLKKELLEIYEEEKIQFFKEKKKNEEQIEKIGDIVKGVFKDIITNNNFPDEKILLLQDRKYCNETFGSLGYPVLKAVDPTREIKEQTKYETEKNGGNRFYAEPITVKGKKYFLCSQWRNKNLKSLKAWIEENKI